MYYTQIRSECKARKFMTLSFITLLFHNTFYAFSSAKELIILHNNNIFSRFEEINNQTGNCLPDEICIGGFGRLSTVIKRFREYGISSNGPAVIYLFAGGLFTGTIWFSIHKSKIAAEMMNLLSPEAMSIGYTEFQAGTRDLAAFLSSVKFPIICANIDVTQEPDLKNIVKSTIIEMRGIKVGIVGHIVQRADVYTIIKDDISFKNEVIAIETEADVLRKKGAHVIISLGYSDWSIHERIARTVRNVDVVIGSMKNMLFINGKPPAGVTKVGNYPQIIDRYGPDKKLKKTPIVTTYGYTEFLGCLNLTLTSNNRISKAVGQAIYMKNSIEQDPEVIKVLNKYRSDIDVARHEIIASSKVPLDGGKRCYLKECNLGNLMADAYVAHRAKEHTGRFWTDTPVAFIHGSMIERGLPPIMNFNVSRGDIMDCFPVEFSASAFDIQGRYLLDALEISASEIAGNEGAEFLQYSGMYVVYDFSQPVGKRLVSAEIRCANCSVPHYTKVRKGETYRVMAPRLLANGGLGYDVLKRNLKGEKSTKVSSTDIFIEYIKKRKIISPTQTDRIIIYNLDAAASNEFLAKLSLVGFTYIMLTYFIDFSFFG